MWITYTLDSVTRFVGVPRNDDAIAQVLANLNHRGATGIRMGYTPTPAMLAAKAAGTNVLA